VSVLLLPLPVPLLLPVLPCCCALLPPLYLCVDA